MDINKLDYTVKSWFPQIRDLVMESAAYKMKTKRDFRDLATEVDIAVQQLIESKIKQLPGDQVIIGEETYQASGQDGQADNLWLIDPIDGTANFVKQAENYATMIAYFSKGQPILSYIYDIYRDDLYWARQGQGVYLNDEKMPIPENLSLQDSLVGISPRHVKGKAYFSYLLDQAFDIRNYGCSSLDGISVIKGQYGAFINPGAGPWDYSPLILMAQEQGLHFSRLDGTQPDITQPSNFIIASQSCYDELAELLAPYSLAEGYENF
ncbi:hypothetical protein AWM75_02055 [Aerococcus urinaehominis]|uniref:Uncharacterized protein n=1 Tax=Aerococcus urinaehominis TaxID=128944 RepID=A0A0X8FK96_9LACT|nr:inositol monophosphatase family protein [Aerococcus urinaehominis]AMB98849.1 hypothetical protein AWM75_02055 [Aerococcus urinaehominis]SDM17359.1 fructose-1,6-bisphosphatase [Aerococcus urinaehominis]